MPDPSKSHPAEGPAAGIDLGGTNIQVGITDPAGRILGRSKCKTEPEAGFEGIVARIGSAVREACTDAGVSADDLSCAGIGTPGPVDPSTGVVLEAVNLRWNNAPLREALQSELGTGVYVDNDVNAAIYGEWKLGSGKGSSDMLGVWVGTGVGGGLILRGQPFHGHFHSAGEIGHMILVPGAAPGSRSVEHNCSRTAIASRITQLIRANQDSSLRPIVEKGSRIKSKVLATAYAEGDPLVCEVINDAADRLGMAIGSIASLLSLKTTVIGGGLTEALGEPYVERVRRASMRECFPECMQQMSVVESSLGDDAGIVGAALLGVDHTGV